MIVIMPVAMMVIMLFLQQKGTDHIDHQAGEGHRNSFVEANGLG
jgi:hypothetical protein